MAQWREEQARAVTEVRSEARGVQRAAEDGLRLLQEGATELAARVGELAGLQGAIDAVTADQHQTAHQVEEEVRNMIAEWREEKVRAVEEARSEAQGMQQVAEEGLRRLQEGVTELAARVGDLAGLQGAIDAVTADQHRTVQQIAEVRNAIAEWRGEQVRSVEEVRSEAQGVQQEADEGLRRLQESVTELTARIGDFAGLQGVIDAATADQRQTAHQVAEMRDLIAEWREEQGRLASAVQAAKMSAPGEQDTLLKFIDGCEAQLTKFAARLDADAALRSKVAALAAATTVRQFDELGAAIEQLRQEQAQTVAVARAEAAEASLAAARAVSRLEEIVTDAESQRAALAEIRAAIEGLRADQVAPRSEADASRVSSTALADTSAGAGDVFFGLRGTLIDCVRQQVEALKSGAPWTPGIRRALSLLVDSMLAAVVAPALRQLLGSSDATSADDVTSALDPPPDARSPDESSPEEALFVDS
jgi:chromosome segregation ATPase